MSNAFNIFCCNINDVKLVDTFYIATLNTNPLLQDSLSDILRMEIITVISAMDNYFHKLVKDGIVEAYFQRRTRTKKWNNATI